MGQAASEDGSRSWPARLPFYYGWVHVVLAAIAMSATFPGRTYGLGIIKESVRADLGIGDLRFSWLNCWAIIIGAVVVWPVGWLIDLLGARLVLTGVALALGSSVLLMSGSNNETDFFTALTLVRGFGQGALSVVAIALVGKWFRKRAGLAMGLFTVLLSVGFIVPIFVVGEAVKTSGWRMAWNGVGLSLILGLVPLAILFARSSPESCGIKPDDPAPDSGLSEPMSLREALTTPAFWVYTAAATVFNLTFSALTLDSEQLLKEHGLNAEVNETILAVLLVSGLPVNIVAGALARRRPMGKLLAAGVAILAASLALFPFIGSQNMAIIYAALLGASGGIITVIYFAIYGHTYGRTHLGSIQGAVQVLSVLASAAGPVILSEVRAWNSGASQPFFFAFAGCTVLLAIAAWCVPAPRRTVSPEPEVMG